MAALRADGDGDWSRVEVVEFSGEGCSWNINKH